MGLLRLVPGQSVGQPDTCCGSLSEKHWQRRYCQATNRRNRGSRAPVSNRHGMTRRLISAVMGVLWFNRLLLVVLFLVRTAPRYELCIAMFCGLMTIQAWGLSNFGLSVFERAVWRPKHAADRHSYPPSSGFNFTASRGGNLGSLTPPWAYSIKLA